MAEADDSTMEVSFPESIPEIECDARRYCYINGIDVTDGTADITKICHSPSKFEFNIRAGQISPHTPSGPLPRLIGEFVDSVLITRIEIRAKVLYKCKPIVRMRVNIHKGDIASCSDVQKGYEYISYPTTNLKPTYTTQHVDHGKYCHIRAHQDYCLELDTNITGDALITDIEVFIRVQAPERVGGICLIITHGILTVWQGITQSNLKRNTSTDSKMMVKILLSGGFFGGKTDTYLKHYTYTLNHITYSPSCDLIVTIIAYLKCIYHL